MSENKNEVVKQGKPKWLSSIASAQDHYLEVIAQSAEVMNIQYDDYQKVCVMNLLVKMQEVLEKEGLMFNDVNQNNLKTILENAAMLRLNAAASPRECYVIIRNVKKGDKWFKEFEFGVEGDGNDKILRKYGVEVEKVCPIWIVREGDEFTYASFKGLDIEPPTWVQKGCVNKVLRVVYPIIMTDGSVNYHISEREEVRFNLLAHISNNVMKKSDKDGWTAAKKAELSNRIKDFTLDELFADEECLSIMSPSWRAPHSREAMILRKMRNNCIKKIPKSFENAFQHTAYESTFDEYDQYEKERPNPSDVLDAEFSESAGKEELSAPIIVDEVNTSEVVESGSESIEQPSNKRTAGF